MRDSLSVSIIIKPTLTSPAVVPLGVLEHQLLNSLEILLIFIASIKSKDLLLLLLFIIVFVVVYYYLLLFAVKCCLSWRAVLRILLIYFLCLVLTCGDCMSSTVKGREDQKKSTENILTIYK